MSLANIVLEQVRPDRWEGYVEAGHIYVTRVHIEADTGNKILREAMRVYAELMGHAMPKPPEPEPVLPTVVDVPYLSRGIELFYCTMGNWTGEPTSYFYQWKRDGAINIGSDDNEYMAQVDDIGHAISCIVTATNASGSTVAPPSNEIVFEMPVDDEPDDGLRRTSSRRPAYKRPHR